MIIIEVQQGTEAWFEHRLGRITASQFSTLMSGESTKGYKDLIVTTALEIITKDIEESYSNAAMERGIELEPFAAKEYENMFDINTEEVGFCIPESDNEFHEWIGVSPDRLVQEGILEIKCPYKKTHWEYITKSVLPNAYKWQVQGQLYVTGAKWCDFMSYHPNMKSFIIRVYPDLRMHEQIEERLKSTIPLIKEEIRRYENYSSLNYINETDIAEI